MVIDAYHVLEFFLCVNSLNSNTSPAMLVLLATPFYRVEIQIRLTDLPKVKAPVRIQTQAVWLQRSCS